VPGTFAKVVALVRRIPRGRVATYGQLAKMVRTTPRVVGFAMRSPGEFPWHRVLGQRRRGIGHITIGDERSAVRQRQLLEREGVKFSLRGDIDLAVFGWTTSSAGGRQSARRGARS
jgi:methylated-DNA-protein-cysteine methyltransferase-like protein